MDDDRLDRFVVKWPSSLVVLCRYYVEPAIFYLRRVRPSQESATFFDFKRHHDAIIRVWNDVMHGDQKPAKRQCAFDIDKLHPFVKYIHENREIIATICHRKFSDQHIMFSIKSFHDCWQATGTNIVETWKCYVELTGSKRPGGLHDHMKILIVRLLQAPVPKAAEAAVASVHLPHHPMKGKEANGAANHVPRIAWEADESEKDNQPELFNSLAEKEKAALATKLERSSKSKEALLKELEEKDERIKALEEDKNDFLQRIAQLMEDRISADETDLENLAFTARPMRLSEAFRCVSSQEWLEAKQELDQHLGSSIEKEKCLLLVEIYKICYQSIQDIHAAQTGRIFRALDEPLQFWGKGTQFSLSHLVRSNSLKEGSETVEQAVLPTEVRVAVSKYARHHSDNLDVGGIAQDIITHHCPEDYKVLLKNIGQGALLNFITSLLKLSWKMVHQLPPMALKFPDEFNPDVQELNFGSKPLPAKGTLKKSQFYYVHPCLYHGDKLVVKAKIFIE